MALVIAGLIGTIRIWIGVNQILSIGVGLLSLLMIVVKMLGFGRQRVQPINPGVTVDPEDVQIEINRDDSSRRVEFRIGQRECSGSYVNMA